MPLQTVPPALNPLETAARLMLKALSHEETPAPDGPALVLDLGDVEVMTAAGLGQLVALHSRLAASGGRLVLCNVGEMAYRAFDVTGLTRLIDIRRAGVVRPASEVEESQSEREAATYSTRP